MRLHIIFIIFLFLTACQSEQNYRKELRTWLGKTEAELIAARGVPDQAFVSNDGIRYLSYYSSSLTGARTRVSCSSSTSTGFSTTTSCQQLYCKEIFVLEKNSIRRVEFEGKNCW